MIYQNNNKNNKYLKNTKWLWIFVGLCAACSAADTANNTNNGRGGGTEGGPPAAGEAPKPVDFSAGEADAPAGSVCKVHAFDDNAVPECEQKAPAGSFAPVLQWQWTAPEPAPGSLFSGSFQTPLVANLTDDNGDGAVDLCDIPDVVVGAVDTFAYEGFRLVSTSSLHVLSGDTGALKLTFASKVDTFVYPALGDIDNDGLPEIVAGEPSGKLVAFETDGSVKWIGDPAGYQASFSSAQCVAVSLYDLEGDGDIEILAGFEVFNAQGKRLWGLPGNASEWDGQFWCVTPTAADLDGDGSLEVLFGHVAYRADGTLYFKLDGFAPGHPQVANFDADPEPEIVLTNKDGLTILEADGSIKLGPVRPTDPEPSPNCWGKPATVHDFDGDGKADIAAGTCSDFSVYSVAANALKPLWSSPVKDISGLATASAFDFLGDGVADAIYADESTIFVFDGADGSLLMTAQRSSATLIEYPVVADVDNDGSAELISISNYSAGGSGP
ncbi:MAG: VCBS repeat-containing protein, partial [Polyangiaceae bacterium]|nr:VCBS repeat-containing protein [Polyangiaceae bacterium]